MNNSERDFLRRIQQRAARVAIGPSPTRGQGSANIVGRARAFAAALPLRPFATNDPRLFARRLDSATREMQGVLPRPAATWGLARKLINIFLRDCVYTSYLRDAYRLDVTEPHLEIPLDSITAKQIRIHAPGSLLPRWPGVKHLQPDVSQHYQAAAQMIADLYGISRVHLDADWWGGRE